MTLSCYCFDVDTSGWSYLPPDDFSILSTKRSRKCCSCNTRINIGKIAVEFKRQRLPSDRYFYIEERIYGDYVPLAPWFMCEKCGELYFNFYELGFCIGLGDNMQNLLQEYIEAYQPQKIIKNVF